MKEIGSVLFALWIGAGCGTWGPKPQAKENRPEGRVYQAKGGESLFDLAEKCKVPVNEILLENPSLHSCTLKRGDRVFIPSPQRRGERLTKKSLEWGMVLEKAFFNFGLRLPLVGKIKPLSLEAGRCVPLAFEIAGPLNREVRSVDDGWVVLQVREDREQAGLTVIVEHNRPFLSCYRFLESVKKQTGEWVQKGEILGTAGILSYPRAPGIQFSLLSICSYPMAGLYNAGWE